MNIKAENSLDRSTPWKARLCIIAAAALFSTGGAAIKSTPFDGLETAGLRSLVAALCLMALIPAVRRNWTLRLLPVALAFAVTMLLFVMANKLTTAAATIFLESTAPLHVALIGIFFLRARPTPADLRLMGLVAGGFLLFFMGQDPATETAPDPGKGNWLAAAAGVTWALTVMGLRWLKSSDTDGFDGMRAVTIGNLMAGAVGLALTWPLTESGPEGWIAVTYLGAIQVAFAYVFLLRGLKEIAALEASLLLLAEPALTPVWAFLLHDERPALTTFAGGVLILGAAGQQLLRKNPVLAQSE